MKVELISIGDELLIGQTVNTNAAWLGQELSLIGASVERGVVIKDAKQDIIDAIDQAFGTVDLIIVTGGLGPTRDDITKEVLCDYFVTELEINEKVLDHIRDFFEKRGRQMLDMNVRQAALPKDAEIMFNTAGTAAGMWFEKDGKVLISLPGVPHEMMGMMRSEGFERIKAHFELESIYYRTLQTQGLGESFLADRIKDIEDNIRNEGFGLAYLPSPGLVRLRITSRRSQKQMERVDEFLQMIAERLPDYVYGFDGVRLSEIVGEQLRSRGLTLGTVESCTGGAVAREIVSIAGSSDYFLGGIVSYSNELKERLVGVPSEDLRNHGAVSQQVVEQMAKGGLHQLGVDYCIATSGIAGPSGGTDDKPVGTVWVAIASGDHVISKCFSFGKDRIRNIDVTATTALNLLRCELLRRKE